ncbi:hypothetical protein [Bacteroides sp. 519]|uniref:hypothetical protein n=1 Tax=Bacteroides sp. 519 TaxID=2302937 RepID=UPI0013D3F996|nr:hypothetical protein [Bacteroides sp. 519]NDV58064.1 hypothetical protein [Bacteroides sp. 519]
MPVKVSFADGNSTSYLYDAAGVKHQVKHQTGSTTKTTDYCGSVIYEDNEVKRVLTSKGYIVYNNGTPTYYYYLKDHLGNNRVVINAGGDVQQVNHYYPFGGSFASSAESLQPFKYNGKELNTVNGLDLYDYSAIWSRGLGGLRRWRYRNN